VPSGFRGSSDGQPIQAQPAEPATPAEPEAKPAKPAVPERPVVGHGGNIPPERITERIARERKKLLKSEYGTDDPIAVERIRKERQERESRFTELQQQEEERKRQAMTEQQRIQSDLEAERARNEQLQAQIRELREQSAYKDQEVIINTAASKYVAPTSLEYAKFKLTTHLNSLTPEEVKQIDQKKLDRWFAKFAQEEPAHRLVVTDPAAAAAAVAAEEARKKAEAEAAAKRPVPKRQPITTTAKPAAGPPKPAASSIDPLGGKTPKPGQPNSMTKPEYTAYKRSLGFRQ
jgi:ribosomal protein S13